MYASVRSETLFTEFASTLRTTERRTTMRFYMAVDCVKAGHGLPTKGLQFCLCYGRLLRTLFKQLLILRYKEGL